MANCPDERLRQGLLELADKAVENCKEKKAFPRAGSCVSNADVGTRPSPISVAPLSRILNQHRLGIDVPWDCWPWGATTTTARPAARCSSGSVKPRRPSTHGTWLPPAPAPDTARDWATAIALADKALQSDSTSDETLSVFGASLYRAGRFDEAFVRLSEAAALIQEPSPASELSPAYPWFFLAMTQHSRGEFRGGKAVAR